jgi:hypothetical protein
MAEACSVENFKMPTIALMAMALFLATFDPHSVTNDSVMTGSCDIVTLALVTCAKQATERRIAAAQILS